MVTKLITTKCRGLGGMTQFISRFTTSQQQENGNQETYYDSVKKTAITFETKEKVENGYYSRG